MKAIKTEELIDELCQVAFRFKEKDNKKLHDLCQLVDPELKELERRAKIGDVFVNAIKSETILVGDFGKLSIKLNGGETDAEDLIQELIEYSDMEGE